MDEIDWAARWRSIVEDRSTLAHGHADTAYWDRRASSFARSTHVRSDELLQVLEPYLAPHKTLIDVGAGTGRHAAPLAERLEWVTAVEPSEGMRSRIAPHENLTLVASTWEDADVAPADLVICSHVMYGVADAAPFLEKMERAARERVFVMIRETPLPHPGAEVRRRLAGESGPRVPRFSELFMVLVQMGVAPDVAFLRYPIVTRYADMDEAVVDVRALAGDAWDDAKGREILDEILERRDGELVYDGGVALSGVAHWRPRPA